MINSRCFFTLKTAYNCLQTVSKNNMLDELKTDDHTAFNTEIGHFALNTSLGTPQHKKNSLQSIYKKIFDIILIESLLKIWVPYNIYYKYLIKWIRY